MRRRLMVALVGLVAGVLLIAGAGSLVLTRNSARDQATQQLVAEAKSLTSGTAHTQSLTVLRVIARVLNLEDARVVAINARGKVTSPLPAGVSAADLNSGLLLDGQSISGLNRIAGVCRRAGDPDGPGSGPAAPQRPTRHSPDPASRGSGSGLGLFHHRRRGDAPGRGVGGVADEPEDVSPLDRGDAGDRANRLRRSAEPGLGTRA